MVSAALRIEKARFVLSILKAEFFFSPFMPLGMRWTAPRDFVFPARAVFSRAGGIFCCFRAGPDGDPRPTGKSLFSNCSSVTLYTPPP